MIIQPSVGSVHILGIVRESLSCCISSYRCCVYVYGSAYIIKHSWVFLPWYGASIRGSVWMDFQDASGDCLWKSSTLILLSRVENVFVVFFPISNLNNCNYNSQRECSWGENFIFGSFKIKGCTLRKVCILVEYVMD